MSLKTFHLVFVTLLTLLSFGFAAWGFLAYAGADGTMKDLSVGLTGVAAGVLVIFYGVYFLKKLKRIGYL